MYVYKAPRSGGDAWAVDEESSITKAEWEIKTANPPKPDWLLKEFESDKIRLRLLWIGRYRKSLPFEYRKHYQVEVANRLMVRKSELEDEDTKVDRGFILDKTATESFPLLSEAEGYFEDILARYTESYFEETEEGDLVLIEVGNKLAPKKPGEIELDDEKIDAAKEKGIDLGGWS